MGRTSFVLSLLLIAACADKPTRSLDAAVETDSSASAIDASQDSDSAAALDATEASDAALSGADGSASPGIDASSIPPDAGLSVSDGGFVLGDLGLVRPDAGLVRLDSGLPRVDAAVIEPVADLSAPPQCLNDGTRSEGWYAVNGVRICWANCQPDELRAPVADARNCGLRSEGWYAPVRSADCVATTGGLIASYFNACE
jgi:hypothetical protein